MKRILIRFMTVAALVFCPFGSQAIGSETVDLWPEGKIPGPLSHAEGEERDLTKDDDRLIAGERIIKLGHVSKPQVEIFLPLPEKRNGTGIVVCPGGGFSILAWDLEGAEVAERFSEMGFTVAVLKYRVPTREHGEEGKIAPKKALGPMMDTQRALSLVRSRANEWNLNEERIGLLGFSAGGQAAALATVATGKRAYEKIDSVDGFSCASNFAMLIYPGGLVDEKTGSLKPFYPVSDETPPIFFVHAADDRVTCLSSSALFTEMKKAGASAELHIYAKGGHGYGLRPTVMPVTHWPSKAENWMRSMKLFDAPLSQTGSSDSLTDFAEDQAVRKKSGISFRQFSLVFPGKDAGHAQEVQSAFVELLLKKDKLAGIKGAVVGKGGQDAFAIDGPLSATLFRSGWHFAKDKPEIAIREGENPGIETELGIILAKPVTKELAGIEELKKHVRAIVPVIELPAGKMDWPERPKAVDLIAANVGSDNYIVGEESADLSIDLDALPIQLFAGDELINETTGGDAHRGQWWNFLHQINWAVKQGYELKPGHLVITGALGKIRKDGAGNYRATFGELGEITFSLK